VCIWGVSVQSDGLWPYGCFRSVDACTPFKIRGVVVSSTDRVCLHGCLLCVDACPPLLLLFLIYVFQYFVCIWGDSVQSDGVWPYGCFRSVDACTPFKIRGVVVSSTDRVCLHGCLLCVDACPPLLLLFLIYVFQYFVIVQHLTYVSDTAYQWAPLHVFM
jgi:ferredoxin